MAEMAPIRLELGEEDRQMLQRLVSAVEELVHEYVDQVVVEDDYELEMERVDGAAPRNRFHDCKDLAQLMHEAIGAGSVCWSRADHGVFDDREARRVADDAMERMTQIVHQSILDRILFITGTLEDSGIPKAVAEPSDGRPRFVLLGFPHQFIEELTTRKDNHGEW